jgi:DNA-binding NarL/FixJ family response regulator
MGEGGNMDGSQNELDDRPPASVLAVDDQATFRAVLCRIVNETHSLVVVGEADSGETAFEMARTLGPDLVLMDVRMPGIGGIAATTRIKGIRPGTVVVLVSTTHPEQLVEAAAECSADETVWKSELRPSLLDDIWHKHGSA